MYRRDSRDGRHRRTLTGGYPSRDYQADSRSNRNRTRSLDQARRDAAPYPRDRQQGLRNVRNVSVPEFIREPASNSNLDQTWTTALVLSQASFNLFKQRRQEPQLSSQLQLPRGSRDARILREERDARRSRPVTSSGPRERRLSGPKESRLSGPRGTRLSGQTGRQVVARNGKSAAQMVTKGRNRNGPFHASRCPIPGCNTSSSKLKHHMFATHLPFYFKDNETEKELKNEMLHRKRAVALKQLASWILGRGRKVEGLAGLINRRKLIPAESKILGQSVPAMRLLCKYEGWRVPQTYSLHPVNSPAALLHWRALAALLKLLTANQREVFRNFGEPEGQAVSSDRRNSGRQDLHPVNTWHGDGLDINVRERAQSRNVLGPLPVPERRLWDLPVTANRHMLGPAMVPVMDIPNIAGPQLFPDQVVQHTPILLSRGLESNLAGSRLPGNQEVEIPLLPAIDCFYHLDKTAMELFGTNANCTTDKLLLYGPKPPAGYTVNLLGGVQVFSDPEMYPTDIPASPKWKVALGVHPLKGHLLTDQKFGSLLRLMATKDVAALGVIGLDRSAPFDTWVQQEKIFREVLKFAKDDQPLIIHVRGQINDPYATDVHARCLKLLQECRPRNQLLHLHCFRGMKEQLVDWLTAFPNTYFGFTAKCIDFDEHQLQALRAVPTDRILIESNSPRKWPALGVEVTTPSMIGAVGMVVATQGHYNCQELMHITTANARRLYSI